ncbi:MAG: hypothetical protein ACE5K7_03560 [Phycisphaerae bacterium]
MGKLGVVFGQQIGQEQRVDLQGGRQDVGQAVRSGQAQSPPGLMHDRLEMSVPLGLAGILGQQSAEEAGKAGLAQSAEGAYDCGPSLVVAAVVCWIGPGGGGSGRLRVGDPPIGQQLQQGVSGLGQGDLAGDVQCGFKRWLIRSLQGQAQQLAKAATGWLVQALVAVDQFFGQSLALAGRFM